MVADEHTTGGPHRARRGGRRGDGHHAPGQRRHPRRLRRLRRLQRDPERDPARHRDRHPRGVPGGGRGLRDHQLVRGQPVQPRRVRDRRPDRGTLPGVRPAGPRGGRPLGHAGPAALGARLDGPGHEAAHARPHHVPRTARRLPGQRGGSAARRRRRADHRDVLRPAPGEGGDHRGQAGRRGRGPRSADHRAGDDRDHGHDAARQRDRRRADGPGAARHRHDRAELRDRPLAR